MVCFLEFVRTFLFDFTFFRYLCTMQNTLKILRESLENYEAREAQSIIDLLLEEVCQISRIDRIMHPETILPESQRLRLIECAEKLRNGVPVQQALGYEWFCGARFKVTPDVLIPRPETAELVQWICEDVRAARQEEDTASGKAEEPCSGITEENRSGIAEEPLLSVLDMGTGTGCIALSLARLINNSQVLAIDLSTAALSVARENSCQQGVDNVYFAQCDILKSVNNSYFEAQINRELTGCPQGCLKTNPQDLFKGFQQEKRVFNIIVSNPPYICEQEKKEMSPVVLDHEPSLALFVPDEDPLLFYRTIAEFGLSHLSKDGALYFEINAAYGAEACQMLREMGYRQVELRKDINGRDRMVRALLIDN